MTSMVNEGSWIHLVTMVICLKTIAKKIVELGMALRDLTSIRDGSSSLQEIVHKPGRGNLHEQFNSKDDLI